MEVIFENFFEVKEEHVKKGILESIKSIYITKVIFSFFSLKIKLNIIKFNKSIKKI